MHGADDFVSFPLGFCVEVEQYCQAADASCAPFRRAQENFPLSISAKAWADNGNADLCKNLTTPSYQQADLSLWHKLIAPASGQPGELQLQQYDHLHQQRLRITGSLRRSVRLGCLNSASRRLCPTRAVWPSRAWWAALIGRDLAAKP